MTNGFDETLHRWFVDLRTPWLTDVVRVLTHLGGTVEVDILVVATAVCCTIRTRKVWRGVALVALLLVGELLRSRLNVAIHRPRPPYADWITAPRGWSMPSGHTFNAVVGFGLVALSFRRRVTTVLVFAVALVVGLCRLYLGVHWASDVIVAWALGAAWLAVSWQVLRRG